MKIRNKKTNEVFTDLGQFVLDAQKYMRLDNLVYCDIACMLHDPEDEKCLYVLDECGNWSYFPSDLYEVVKSRPYSPAPEQCPYWWFEQANTRWRCKVNAYNNHDYEEQIRQSEREKVLDELEKHCKDEWGSANRLFERAKQSLKEMGFKEDEIPSKWVCTSMNNVLEKIESLRKVE